MLSHLDLFSGIGGFSLGLESTGVVKTVAFCDYEKWCQKVLKKHWPHVQIYGDVKELTHERLKEDGIDTVDIITGGYPCQPFSVAGSQKGEQDPRHVWPEMFRLIQELRPTWVIGENVSGHIKLGLDTVLENLESEGYATRAFSISASSIGANHQRERVWIMANTTTHRSFDESKRNIRNMGEKSEAKERAGNKFTVRSEARSSKVSNTNGEGSQRYGSEYQLRKSQEEGKTSWLRWWESEPRIRRVAHGIPQRVDRLKGLGNAVVPQIPFLLGLTIREMIENE